MRHLMTTLLLLFTCFLTAQDAPIDYASLNEKYLEKVSTMDATIKTLYEVISGPKGEERNQELLRYLFHPEAKLIAAGKRKDKGKYAARYVTIDDYVNSSLKWMFENGFYENELYRVTEQFGPIAHVFSTYETFHSLDEEIPFMRGINSIQLLDVGNRWVVLSVYFTQESKENPIPDKYLPSK